MLGIAKKELNASVIASVIYFVLGMVIAMRPEETINLVGTIVAVLSIVYGAVISIINIANIKEQGNLTLGILLIVLGVALLIYPSSLSILISLGIGIWFISNSVNRIKFAVALKGVKGVNWKMVLALAVATMLIGVAFIFTPLASAVALTVMGGVLMMIYAACDIFGVCFIKKNIKAIEKGLEKEEEKR